MKISKKLLDNIQRFENVINYKFKNNIILTKDWNF